MTTLVAFSFFLSMERCSKYSGCCYGCKIIYIPHAFQALFFDFGDDRLLTGQVCDPVALRVSAWMDSLKKSMQSLDADDHSYAMAA